MHVDGLGQEALCGYGQIGFLDASAGRLLLLEHPSEGGDFVGYVLMELRPYLVEECLVFRLGLSHANLDVRS